MVSLRCKMIVEQELIKLGIKFFTIDLGVAEFLENLTDRQHEQLNDNLQKYGLELLDDKKSILSEKCYCRNVSFP